MGMKDYLLKDDDDLCIKEKRVSRVRYMSLFFNTLILIGGIVLLVWSIVLLVNYGDNGYYKLPNILIAVSVFIVLMGIIGCVGAWYNNLCCLAIFLAMLWSLFILQIGGGVFVYINVGSLHELGLKVMEENGKDSMVGITASIATDFFQNAYACCGLDGPWDWPEYTIYPAEDRCEYVSTEEPGCYGPMKIFVGGVAAFISVIELVSIIFTSLLIKQNSKLDQDKAGRKKLHICIR